MTASADYGVTISEDFTPPENWVPGQEIEKNVYITNTGNVDAFVRVWLEGEFNLISEGAGITAKPTAAYAPSEITDNDTLKNLDFEEVTVGTDKKYIKLLSTTKTVNSNNSNDPANADPVNALSEVQAHQSGGYLAYAPTGAQYKYTINQNKAVDVYSNTTTHAVTDIPSGSTVHVGGTAAAPASGTYIAPANTAGDIDSDTFLPMTTGLYLFRRNVSVGTTAATDSDWEYSGYYYVAASGDAGGQGKYYALKTKTNAGNATVYADGIAFNDGTATPAAWYVDQQTGAITDDLAIADVKLFTAEGSTVNDNDITWTYTAKNGADPAKLTATITATANDPAKKISVDVALDNVDGTATPNESWQYVAATTGKNATFYYKNDVEEGDTTAKLVDSVTMSKDTKQTAYIAFDFDLNVLMDSIQVTVDADENECFASVQDVWASNTKAVPQTANATIGKEIDTITWTNES